MFFQKFENKIRVFFKCHRSIDNSFDFCLFLLMQPSKFASVLSNFQGFCRRKAAFSLTCVSKFLPKRNCLNNMPVNF